MRSIRRATKDDTEAIANLYRELNTLSPVSVLPERIDAVANSNNTYLLVCDDAGEIIATYNANFGQHTASAEPIAKLLPASRRSQAIPSFAKN